MSQVQDPPASKKLDGQTQSLESVLPDGDDEPDSIDSQEKMDDGEQYDPDGHKSHEKDSFATL